MEEKNKALESQFENAFAEREKAVEEVRTRELNNVQMQAQIVENGVSVTTYIETIKITWKHLNLQVIVDVLKEKNKTLESQLKNAELREKALLEKARELNNMQLQAQIADNGVSVTSYKIENIKSIGKSIRIFLFLLKNI
jgi:hypothetical protein